MVDGTDEPEVPVTEHRDKDGRDDGSQRDAREQQGSVRGVSPARTPPGRPCADHPGRTVRTARRPCWPCSLRRAPRRTPGHPPCGWPRARRWPRWRPRRRARTQLRRRPDSLPRRVRPRRAGGRRQPGRPVRGRRPAVGREQHRCTEQAREQRRQHVPVGTTPVGSIGSATTPSAPLATTDSSPPARARHDVSRASRNTSSAATTTVRWA